MRDAQLKQTIDDGVGEFLRVASNQVMSPQIYANTTEVQRAAIFSEVKRLAQQLRRELETGSKATDLVGELQTLIERTRQQYGGS